MEKVLQELFGCIFFGGPYRSNVRSGCGTDIWSSWVGMPISLARRKCSSRFVSSHACLGWNGSWQHLPKWETWKSNLKGLEKICIRRCIKSEGFGIINEASLHHFSDGSEEGYGQSTYLWLVNVSGKIHCCLLMGKSRETPKKYVTIPRLKLVAVVLSMKKAALIRRELDN